MIIIFVTFIGYYLFHVMIGLYVLSQYYFGNDYALNRLLDVDYVISYIAKYLISAFLLMISGILALKNEKWIKYSVLICLLGLTIWAHGIVKLVIFIWSSKNGSIMAWLNIFDNIELYLGFVGFIICTIVLFRMIVIKKIF